MKNKIFLLIITLLLTLNAGYSMPASVHSSIIKFSYAMLGVIVSSIIIFAGLTVYNKLRSGFDSNVLPEDEVLRHPKTTDEAIKFFIRKNKIQ